METQNTPMPMLDLLLRPAFCVTDGKIVRQNQAAAPYYLENGTDIFSLLYTGQEEYQVFQSGYLYLTLSIAEQKVDAAVTALDGYHLFILEQNSTLAELRALALSARELRTPLTGMFLNLGQLIDPNADPATLAQFNYRSHQLMRIISNMSDALHYCEVSPGQLEYVQLNSYLDELLEKAQDQLAHANIALHYTLPHAPICTLADTEKLERAVYNLLSNAAKHSAPGDSITVSLTQRNRLYLSVTDSGRGSEHALHGNAYERYLRTPSITDGSEGIGLGMVLIRATAALHNGTVLIDKPDGKCTRVTMTMEVRHAKHAQVHSPLFYPDYAGERDHGLQELSEVLPASLYEKENMF